MSDRELDAAGIGDPRLRAAYRFCRDLNMRNGRTFFLATRLLSARQRPAVHALYGFARWVDDIVDDPEPDTSPEQVRARLDTLAKTLTEAFQNRRSDDPVLLAVADSVRRYRIPTRLFDDFLHSMRMDLTTTGYSTRAHLDTYVYGSAEVIGLQVLPVLGTTTSTELAAPSAAALGKAFQLTNFLRDVAEDLERGRVYLPEDELRVFGVDRDVLAWCARNGRTDVNVRRAMADQIATTRAVYRRAGDGIAMLHPVSRPCVATALTLYSEILDQIEMRDHDVFTHRATVPRSRRLAVAASAAGRTLWARRRHQKTPREAASAVGVG